MASLVCECQNYKTDMVYPGIWWTTGLNGKQKLRSATKSYPRIKMMMIPKLLSANTRPGRHAVVEDISICSAVMVMTYKAMYTWTVRVFSSAEMLG
jgi:hypothetical protein